MQDTHLSEKHFDCIMAVADLEKNKGSGCIGMESTGRWSNDQGSLNPKCHYEYQEMGGGGGLATLFIPPPPDPPLHGNFSAVSPHLACPLEPLPASCLER